MKRMCAISALLIALSLSMVRVNPAIAADPIVIRFSHVVGENTPKGLGATMFKERVEQRLAGKVVVEIFPKAEKFDDEEVLLALLFGDVEMAAPSFVQFRGYAPAIEVFSLPFLFKDVEHVHRFQQSVAGQHLLQMVLTYDLQGLAYWDNGMRVISANRPVRVPADVDGLRFRLEPSPVFHAQYARIDAIGIPMPFSRLTDAIRDGLVEGQENAWSNIYSRGIHKLQQHYLELNHSFLGYMVVTNADFWQGLPEEVSTALEAILAEVTEEVNRLAVEKAAADRGKAIAEGGIEVVSPTAEELEQWRKAWLPIWSEFEPQIGKEIIDAAVAAAHAQ